MNIKRRAREHANGMWKTFFSKHNYTRRQKKAFKAFMYDLGYDLLKSGVVDKTEIINPHPYLSAPYYPNK